MAPPVVIVVDDDDEDVAANPPVLRRRSRAARPAAAEDFPDSPDSLDSLDSLEGFSLSPPVPKRRPAVSPIVLDDETPPPPRRHLSGAPEPPGSVVPETPQSFAPCSPGSRDVVADTPNSLLPSSFGLNFDAAVSGPTLTVPVSIDPDIFVADTPVFTTSRPVGPSMARCSAFASSQKLSGASCPISLDSDDDLDDIGYTESLTKLPSNKAKSEPVIQPGTNSRSHKVTNANSTDQDYSKPSEPQTSFSAKRNGEHLCAGLPCEDSSLQEEEKHKKKEDAQLMEKRKKNQVERELKKEEKARLALEKKREKEENNLLKNALKVQQAEQKKFDKEKAEWESGKNVLKSIVAEIDSTIIESGSVGGILLTRFADKNLKYRSRTNSVKGSILWMMETPQIVQYPVSVSEVPYILFVLQAEEFCDLIRDGSFFNHVREVRSLYPTFTICYVTNKLMNYITRRERSQYKNPSSSDSWKRPPVEEVFCKLATHYDRVHSRHCVDEAEVAEHVVGLTYSLANCKSRKPLSWLSVHANGAVVPKNFIDKHLAKNNTWMKALIAIPKVQPRHAVAIQKEYPNMRSLLNVYMDSNKTDREKELLLQDLKCEDSLGDENRRLGPVCSKRVYRILMAQNGAVAADDAE